MRCHRIVLVLLLVICVAVVPSAASARTTASQVRADALALTRAKAGPPGVIITFGTERKTTSIAVGRRDRKRTGAPRASDHMRIASITKAFTAAVIFRNPGGPDLDSKVGAFLPDLPVGWHSVTVAQLLNHTSGIPDYTKSKGFFNQFQTDPTGKVAPSTLIDWVRADPLLFPPGSRYEYSNTDNIIAALILEKQTGESYAKKLRKMTTVYNLKGTSLPTGLTLKQPFIHGYVAHGKTYEDVTSALSPTGAWASGGIESTPRDLGAFFRHYLSPGFIGLDDREAQFKWVKGGESSPAGPGKNSAGLSLFRYQTRCGTVYGHTGNFPGYVQFAAATKDGSKSVTTSLNIPAPTGKLLKELRELQTKAVCLLLKR